MSAWLESRSASQAGASKSTAGPPLAGPARLVLGVAALWLALARGATAEDLWHKAVSLAAASDEWLPGEGLTRSETRDRSGKVKSVEEVQYVYHAAPSGGVESQITKALKDGRDVTAKRRSQAEQARGKREGLAIDSGDHPFSADRQRDVSARATGETRTLAGELCARYDYVLKTKDGAQKGQAWLSLRSGAPLVIEYTLDPLPSHVERLQVTMRYELAAEGHWLLREIVTEGEVGLLFIKRGFRSLASFAKHHRRGANAAPLR